MDKKMSLGFGHFASQDDNMNWQTFSYDGLESTGLIDVLHKMCGYPVSGDEAMAPAASQSEDQG